MFASGDPPSTCPGPDSRNLQQSAFGVFLFVAILPSFIPIPGMGGAVSGPLVILIGLQMLFCLRRPWLPGFIARRGPKRGTMHRFLDRIDRPLRRLDRMLRPRLPQLLTPLPPTPSAACCWCCWACCCRCRFPSPTSCSASSCCCFAGAAGTRWRADAVQLDRRVGGDRLLRFQFGAAGGLHGGPVPALVLSRNPVEPAAGRPPRFQVCRPAAGTTRTPVITD